MITCPLCEHVQAQGGECEVCGRRLPAGPAPLPPVAPIDGLEPTHHLAVAAPASTLAELESTHRAPVEVAADPLELEPTLAAPVDPPVDLMAGIERTGAEIAGDGPTPVSLLVACRYCRTPAASGERICTRCGMRLPAAASAAAEAEAQVVRRCGCGAAVMGRLCPACGARPPS
jgi:hypothetical protein